MKRHHAIGILSIAILLVAATLALVNRAPAQDNYSDRLSALETRVTTLESIIGVPTPTQTPPPPLPTAPSGEYADLTPYVQSGADISLSGTGYGQVALTVVPGSYSASFTCENGTAVVWYGMDGYFYPVPLVGNDGPREVTFAQESMNSLGVICDGDWQFTASPT